MDAVREPVAERKRGTAHILDAEQIQCDARSRNVENRVDLSDMVKEIMLSASPPCTRASASANRR